MDMDFTLIPAQNCSACPYNRYDNRKSEEMGYLKNSTDTTHILNVQKNSKLPAISIGGNFVTDTFTTKDKNFREKAYNQSTYGYEFFLVHNMTGEKKDIDAIKAEMGDGVLGLTPDLGSGKMTFGQHLKKTGLISSNSFSVEYDWKEYDKSKVIQANLTFGKFNTSLNKSSFEYITPNDDTRKAYMIKSKGFSFFGSAYNFGEKFSYLAIDPFQKANGFAT